MKKKVVKKVAKSVVNLCDWMMGYHGKLIVDCIHAVVLESAFFTMFSILVVKFG